MSATRVTGERMPDAPRRLHRALLDALLQEGAVPPPEALAVRSGIAPSDLVDRLQELAAADYLALDATGQVSCLYPFSTVPTTHGVVIDGSRRFAMCAIDALGIPAMLGVELAIDDHCAVCETRLTLRVRPGAIVTASPATAMVVARRDEAEPAFAACCPFTVFVCGPEHAERFVSQVSGTRSLSLAAALLHAEEIFGALLAAELPASRPRGRRWRKSSDG